MLIPFIKTLLTADRHAEPTPTPTSAATEPASTPEQGARDLYIDLLRRSVSNTIYDNDLDMSIGEYAVNPLTGKLKSSQAGVMDAQQKYLGAVWPSHAHTMIGMPRLNNLRWCVETVLQEGIPGDFIETGVWRGGACIFMRGILKAYGVTDRRVWVADSFEGLPVADPELNAMESKLNLHLRQDLAVSVETVQSNFQRYGLLDDQVQFLKGWFCDSLPGAPIDTLSILRLDGDLYESTMDPLESLYDKLSPGGFVIIDDYNVLQACNNAIKDFRAARGITSDLQLIEGAGAFWRK